MRKPPLRKQHITVTHNELDYLLSNYSKKRKIRHIAREINISIEKARWNLYVMDALKINRKKNPY